MNEAVVNDLYETINYNVVKIIKLKEQNNEMLSELKHCRIFVSSRQKINSTGLKLYDELVEKMENDK